MATQGQAGEDDWLTWSQAAARSSDDRCPISTIDWHSRSGRIEKRPFLGRRPTLKRSSVIEFAAWWRDRQEARASAGLARDWQRLEAAHHGSRPVPRPPSPSGWMSTREAAVILEVTAGRVAWLVGRGHLRVEQSGGRLWVRSSLVDELVRSPIEEAQWVSAGDAGRSVACSQSAMLRAAHRGEIVQRAAGRQRSSLAREVGRAVPDTWAARAEGTAARRATPASGRRRLPRARPPWLGSREVAELLDLSRGGWTT
jgi:hypothetical protein